MKRKFFIFGVIALILSACSKDDITVISDKPTDITVPSRHISMRDAKERLRAILPEMTVQTRSSLSIGDGIAFKGNHQVLTRADEADALFYYFPIDNGKQYAIMSARSELPQLLAIGNGNPDAQTLDELIPAVEDWSVSTVGYNLALVDSGGSIGTITEEPVVVRGTPVFIETIPSLDTTINNLCPVKWDQNGWFSQFCQEIEGKPGEHANACCVATAVAQLFAAKKCRPAGWAGFDIDWDLLMSCPDTATMRLNPDAQIHIAELLIELGKPANLNVSYSTFGSYTSTTSPGYVKRTLQNFGFKNGGDLVDFSQEKIINEFKRGYPVIISGWNENDLTGHTWILHGWKIAEVPVRVYQGINLVAAWTEYETYFQCNWGCSGAGDGYFHAMGFDPQRGRAYNPEHTPDCPWNMGNLSQGKLIQVGVEF